MLIDNLAAAIAEHEQTPGFFRDERAGLVDLSGPMPDISGDVDIRAESYVGFREVHFSGDSVAVVAHWSPQGLEAGPSAALRHLLRALRAAGFRVVLTSGNAPAFFDGNAPELLDGSVPDSSHGWLALWASEVEALVWRTCTGYDFTSWKAAFTALPDLFQAREIICCNDSVFGPVSPLKAVHERMAAVPCDVWGMVESRETRRHLQSFYLVFREQAVGHPAFAAFWRAVDTNPDKLSTVRNWEIPFSPWLAAHGLVPAAFVPATCFPETNVNPCHYFWRPLLERFEMPFLKRDLIRRAGEHPFVRDWRTVLARKNFDRSLYHE